VGGYEPWSYAAEDPTLDVQFEVDSEDDLDEERDPKAGSELRVDVL